jgi:predicted transcriptional regulator
MDKQPLARDLMTHPVRRITLHTGVREAAEFLLRWGISGVPVVDEHGRPVGVFTLNDLARHVQERLVHLPEVDARRERAVETGEFIPGGKGFHFEHIESTEVSELMTPGVVMVFGDAPMADVVHSMTSQKIHRVFVMSVTNELEGVITTMDVLRWLDRKGPARRRAVHPLHL